MQRPKILLVDDEVEFIETTKRLLEHRGYDVTTANSGDSAIKALGQGGYGVMVLDLKMPGMDGISTLKEINKLQLRIQTLVLTGHGAIHTAMEAKKLGAYDYLTKPCEIDELIEKLEAAKKEGESDNKKKSLLGALGIRKK
ncbi:MAG: response regulator [Deltaproteobacteria bacterium HGW-Deltaproteobacteria-21]|nr:MAG: response regulator [Deltaproteobacteria bacterium HGW-Deltaproteobacteria-21]